MEEVPEDMAAEQRRQAVPTGEGKLTNLRTETWASLVQICSALGLPAPCACEMHALPLRLEAAPQEFLIWPENRI